MSRARTTLKMPNDRIFTTLHNKINLVNFSLNPLRPGDLKEAFNVCALQDETQVSKRYHANMVSLGHIMLSSNFCDKY